MANKTPMMYRAAQGMARYFVRHPSVLFAAAIVYLISPIDALPEAFLGPVGYLDDFVILLMPFLLREYARRWVGDPEKPSRPKDYYDTTAR